MTTHQVTSLNIHKYNMHVLLCLLHSHTQNPHLVMSMQASLIPAVNWKYYIDCPPAGLQCPWWRSWWWPVHHPGQCGSTPLSGHWCTTLHLSMSPPCPGPPSHWHLPRRGTPTAPSASTVMFSPSLSASHQQMTCHFVSIIYCQCHQTHPSKQMLSGIMLHWQWSWSWGHLTLTVCTF